jgi:hypothetical protein
MHHLYPHAPRIVCCSKLANDDNQIKDPFASAFEENQKIEARQREKSQILNDFQNRVKLRLKEYKLIQQKCKSDNKSTLSKSLSDLKIKPPSIRDNMIAIGNVNLIIDDQNNKTKENVKTLNKVRVSEARKSYSQHHRTKLSHQIVDVKPRAKEYTKKVPSKYDNKSIYVVKHDETIEPHQKHNNDDERLNSLENNKKVITSKTGPKQQHKTQSSIRLLTRLLNEKSSRYKIEIPALCQCQSTKSGSLRISYDPNLCANNCIYYKNENGNFRY